MLATVSRRAHLARQSRLSTKHVGFCHYCARAPTRGGGDAGDRFASSSPRLSASARSAWASITLVYKLWFGEVDMPATVSRRASSCIRSASAQNEARGLPVLLCASLGTKRRLCWPPTCVKLYLACLPPLGTKRAGFRYYCARASARGGGYAGDCFASSSPPCRLPTPRLSIGKERSTRASATVALEPGYKKRIRWHPSCVDLPSVVNISSERSTLASVTIVRELRYEEVDKPATVLHQAPLAHRPQLSSKRVGFHYYCE